MKTKKLMALLLAAAMSLGCLAGCGNTEVKSSEVESQPAKESESVATESTEEVVELEEKTIQIWTMGPGKQKDSDKVWEAFNEMLQEYVPNTTVEFTVIPAAEYADNFNRMLAAEEAVDLAWVGYLAKPGTHIKDGNLLPMDELLAEYGQGILDSLGETVININRYNEDGTKSEDGNIYYTINWQGALSNKYAFWVPTELAELAGDTWLKDTQAAVDTWWSGLSSGENFNKVFDQFEKYFAAAKDAGKLYSGIHPNFCWGAWNGFKGYRRGTPAVNNCSILQNENGEWVAVDGVQSEEKRVWAQRMSEFYEKGYLRSDIASVDLSTLEFVKGGEYNANTVIVYTGALLSDSAEVTTELQAGVDLSYIYREEVAELGTGDTTAMAVPYCADEPERAVMVLNALYTVPELYQLLIYGIEGEHYTDNGDGTITTPYGAEGTAESDYGLYRWTIGTCMNSLVTQNDVKGHYASLLEAESKAEPNKFASFSFDKTEVQDICTALTAIDKTYSKMVDLCASGAEIEAALDKWIEERKIAGVDKVLAELQKQVDEFVKANNIK